MDIEVLTRGAAAGLISIKPGLLLTWVKSARAFGG